jgi:hypothetical protein
MMLKVLDDFFGAIEMIRWEGSGRRVLMNSAGYWGHVSDVLSYS